MQGGKVNVERALIQGIRRFEGFEPSEPNSLKARKLGLRRAGLNGSKETDVLGECCI